MPDCAKTFKLRAGLICTVMLLWSIGIVYRLVDLQILKGEDMRQRSENMHFRTEPIPAGRGEITDANGRLLAINQQETYIFADPSIIENPKETADRLATSLNKGPKWRKQLTSKFKAKKDRQFLYIEQRVPEAVAQKVRELDLEGIYLRSDKWRKYPQGQIASHLIGFQNKDGTVKEGLEFQYDQAMTGEPGKREVMRDGRQRKNDLNAHVLVEPQMGSNLELAVDANIQLFVEDALRDAMKTHQARNMTAIVMDVKTGAILAMANVPDFDPNRFSKSSSFARKNRAVVDVYEPASAFKIITVSAALDLGVINPSQKIWCEEGGITLHGKFIKDNKRFGTLDISQILWHSSNVGSIKIARKMREKDFYNYITAFGFGDRTGIDLPAESSGILAPPSQWSAVSSAYLSMGHEISSTPLQMLMAASVIANDGVLIKPYVAERIIHDDGTIQDLRPNIEPRRVISRKTARTVRNMLLGVVEKGTAKAAQIPGVRVFGKTGTAQRLQGGKYSHQNFNASFVGFFPAEAPRYGMIVVAHDPRAGKVHGGEVAAPIFSQIGRQIMDYDRAREPEHKLVVSRQTPNWSPRPIPDPRGNASLPDFGGMGLRELVNLGQAMGLDLRIKGQGKVIGQAPKAGTPIPENRVCTIRLGEG